MVFTSLYRSALGRLLAALIIVLVMSPYSEPFATIDGTDFGGAGAVDVGDASKLKTSALDALVGAPMMGIFADVPTTADWPALPAVTLLTRAGQRAILRL